MNSQTYTLLELPSKVEYAFLALLEMASQPDPKNPMNVGEITSKQPIPERYLGQILAVLRRGGLLKSHRGARGGYVLARSPQEITLLEIVSLIEGDQQSADDSDRATLEMELIRQSWQQVDRAAQSMLQGSTLADLCQKRNAYAQERLMYYI